MPETPWKPHATVAALCERDGKYLLVRERVGDRVVLNQPAGHIEPGESIVEAVIRETLEETRYRFTARALQGIYRFQPSPDSAMTYLRFAIRGDVDERLEGDLDTGIISAEWLDYEEILECRTEHRSPMVLQCVEDHRRHPGYPLDVLSREFA